MSRPVVAVVGLGTIGAGIASSLVRAGFEVRPYSRSQRPLAVGEGPPLASHASAAAAAARTDVAIVCVADDAATEAVALGADGALAGLGPGAVLVDCGTTSPALTSRLAAACAARGVGFAATPVTGSKLGAEQGALVFIGGGPAQVRARLEPVLAAAGRRTIWVGDAPEQAQRAKLALNAGQAVILQGTLEALALAASGGVPYPAMREIFEHSAGRSGVGAFKLPYLERGDFQPHFRLALMHKDLALALAQAHDAGVALPLVAAVERRYREALDRALGDEDFLATAKLFDRPLAEPS